MQFYTKGDDGEFAEVTQEQLESEFKPRYERFKKTEAPRIRTEVEAAVREELAPKLTDEIRTQLDAEYKPKLEEAEGKLQKLDVQVRQKTIAAEYGFTPDLEGFLGEGSDEEMKAKADILKNSRVSGSTPPTKTTAGNGTSDVQKRTGVVVDIK